MLLNAVRQPCANLSSPIRTALTQRNTGNLVNGWEMFVTGMRSKSTSGELLIRAADVMF